MQFDLNVFVERQPGLASDELASLDAYLQAPLSNAEIAELDAARANIPGCTSAREWQVRIRDIPRSYAELLQVSHGGYCTVGEREISYFEKQSLREYLLHYEFPVYMPNALPFGLNGGGVFYIFDMRSPSAAGEYPIRVSHASCLSYDDSAVVAADLYELLSVGTNVEAFL